MPRCGLCGKKRNRGIEVQSLSIVLDTTPSGPNVMVYFKSDVEISNHQNTSIHKSGSIALFSESEALELIAKAPAYIV